MGAFVFLMIVFALSILNNLRLVIRKQEPAPEAERAHWNIQVKGL